MGDNDNFSAYEKAAYERAGRNNPEYRFYDPHGAYHSDYLRRCWKVTIMPEDSHETQQSLPMKQRVLRSLGLASWVVVSFYAANLLIGLIITLLAQVNLIDTSTAIDSPVFIV